MGKSCVLVSSEGKIELTTSEHGDLTTNVEASVLELIQWFGAYTLVFVYDTTRGCRKIWRWDLERIQSPSFINSFTVMPLRLEI